MRLTGFRGYLEDYEAVAASARGRSCPSTAGTAASCLRGTTPRAAGPMRTSLSALVPASTSCGCGRASSRRLRGRRGRAAPVRQRLERVGGGDAPRARRSLRTPLARSHLRQTPGRAAGTCGSACRREHSRCPHGGLNRYVSEAAPGTEPEVLRNGQAKEQRDLAAVHESCSKRALPRASSIRPLKIPWRSTFGATRPSPARTLPLFDDDRLLGTRRRPAPVCDRSALLAECDEREPERPQRLRLVAGDAVRTLVVEARLEHPRGRVGRGGGTR